MPTIGYHTLTMTGSTAERIEKLWNHIVDMLMPVERCRWEWVPKDLFCLGLVGTDSPKGVDNDNDGDQSAKPPRLRNTRSEWCGKTPRWDCVKPTAMTDKSYCMTGSDYLIWHWNMTFFIGNPRSCQARLPINRRSRKVKLLLLMPEFDMPSMEGDSRRSTCLKGLIIIHMRDMFAVSSNLLSWAESKGFCNSISNGWALRLSLSSLPGSRSPVKWNYSTTSRGFSWFIQPDQFVYGVSFQLAVPVVGVDSIFINWMTASILAIESDYRNDRSREGSLLLGDRDRVGRVTTGASNQKTSVSIHFEPIGRCGWILARFGFWLMGGSRCGLCFLWFGITSARPTRIRCRLPSNQPTNCCFAVTLRRLAKLLKALNLHSSSSQSTVG